MIDYDKLIANNAYDIQPSGIRRFFDMASAIEGTISLAIGEPDFKTPWSVRKAAIRTLEKGKTSYTANSGLIGLRESICKYMHNRIGVQYNPENETLVTVGGSEAIDLAIRALINPGDEVLIPEPSFVCYSPIVTLTGGVPVPVKTLHEDKFRLTADSLKAKITPKTKMLVLPYPNNPTGAIMKRPHLEEIAKCLRDTNIIILSDELYSELTYSDKHVSIVEIDNMRERTILINGFSKNYAMTGWRLGFAVGPAPIIKQMLKIHQYAIMSSPTVSQYAAIDALENCDADIEYMRKEYNIRRKYLVSSFNRIGLDCFEPEGAFYVFPSIKGTGLSSNDFCERLLKSQKVAVVPGNAFGESGEGYVRVSYAYSLNHLKTAIERIECFLKELEG